MQEATRWIFTVMITAGMAYGASAAGKKADSIVVKKKVEAAARPNANDTLVITARLIEIPGTFPANDLYDYVYVMKYRIVTVEKGAYSGPEIFVGHYNPRIPRRQVKDAMDPHVDGTVDKFTQGAVHRLWLIKPVERVWENAVEDEYVDSDLEKYYALKADFVK